MEIHLGTGTRTSTLSSADRLHRLLDHVCPLADRTASPWSLLSPSISAVPHDAGLLPRLSAGRQCADHSRTSSHRRCSDAREATSQIKALLNMASLRDLSLHLDVVWGGSWKRSDSALDFGSKLRDMERLHAHSADVRSCGVSCGGPEGHQDGGHCDGHIPLVHR